MASPLWKDPISRWSCPSGQDRRQVNGTVVGDWFLYTSIAERILPFSPHKGFHSRPMKTPLKDYKGFHTRPTKTPTKVPTKTATKTPTKTPTKAPTKTPLALPPSLSGAPLKEHLTGRLRWGRLTGVLVGVLVGNLSGSVVQPLCERKDQKYQKDQNRQCIDFGVLRAQYFIQCWCWMSEAAAPSQH